MGDSVQKRAGEPLRAEDFGPLFEGQVACDQRGRALVALAEGLEEQLGSGPILFRESSPRWVSALSSGRHLRCWS